MILLGLITLVVFLFTLTAGQAQTNMLLAGSGLCLLGLLLRRRRRPVDTKRARFLRRMLGRPQDHDRED
jgi:hypothetical protein